jgi:hypothetical protein
MRMDLPASLPEGTALEKQKRRDLWERWRLAGSLRLDESF